MSLSVGDRLGPYEILALIGAGGMGEVYRARDTKLKRDVALKVLPEAFASDSERMARFQREAEVLASLNHPNIAQIYGVEERALAMELVEGAAPKGPMPLDDAWKIASQIAAALEYAHDRGIIHRDLKPANIKVTPDGNVKLLDFGLAKAFTNQREPQTNAENSPTLTIAPTQVGVILGTAAYMPPEQAKGKSVDKRADIWSFGVVLFEMLTGKPLFPGADVSEVLAAVIKDQPDLTAVPAQVRPLLRRCLEKDPRKRLRDIGDAMPLLEADRSTPEIAPATSGISWKIATAVFGIALLALTFVYLQRPAESPRVLKMAVLPPDKATFDPNSPPAVSPDGRRIAFVAALEGKNRLWVRDLDSLTARALPGTDAASYPFWSPDNRFVGFFAGGKLKKIDVAGGPTLTLCDAPATRGGTWSQNNVIVFAPNGVGPLLRVPDAGGNAIPATELDPNQDSHRHPWFLPDGRHFLYLARTAALEKIAVYVGDLDSKDRRAVLKDYSNAVYAAPGYLLFSREETLMAQPFDAGKGKTTGDAVPIAEQVDLTYLRGGGSLFSVSQNGVLAYMSGVAGRDVQLTWFDRSGKAQGTVGSPGVLGSPAISPDGTTVAVDRASSQSSFYDLWLNDLVRGTSSRFTFGPRANQFAIWSPDGRHIAFRSTRGGMAEAAVFQRTIGGGAEDEVLDNAPGTKLPTDWSRDGRYIIEQTSNDPKTRTDIWVLPLFGDRKPFPYVRTEFGETGGKLSPDGKWLAYASDETSRNEVYVQTFPEHRGKWQVSANGGDRPVWSRDGKELFFIDADRKLMAVPVKGGPKFEAGAPQPLFDTLLGAEGRYDVGTDGRFLIPAQIQKNAGAPMTVVINWQALLKK